MLSMQKSIRLESNSKKKQHIMIVYLPIKSVFLTKSLWIVTIVNYLKKKPQFDVLADRHTDRLMH